MLNFFNFLWISFSLCSIASFFIFFAQKFSTFINGLFLFLTGISLQFIATDVFSNTNDGKYISAAILFVFIFELILFSKSKSIFAQSKPESFFYLLPFLAFLTMGLATDLLVLFLALTLFGLSFLFLAQVKGKPNLQNPFLKINVGLLAFAYGMSILFSREGTILFAPLRLKLSLGNWDNWTTLGVGLLIMGIIIELYAILPLIGKNKK